MITPLKVWYAWHSGVVEVATLEELDALLDRIEADQERHELPVLVTIASADEQRCIQVLVGRGDLSLLIWYVANHDILASKGNVPTIEKIIFNFGGTPTESYVDTAIPIATARRAVREFAATGRLPTSVEWQIPAWPGTTPHTSPAISRGR